MTFIIPTIFVVSFICIAYMGYKVISTSHEKNITTAEYCKLSVSGIVSFFFDTIGVGSFAVNIALCKFFKLFSNKQLPAIVNVAQVIPGTIGAIFFLTVVKVDTITLVSLIIAATIGGIIGSIFVSKINAKLVEISMIAVFIVVAIILLIKQLDLISIEANLVQLRGWKLFLGFFGTMMGGFFTSFGVGLFILIQTVLFLLGVVPIVAFPIMTAAGAIQQPIAAISFVYNNKLPLKRILILSCSAILGVIIAIPIISSLSSYVLHWILLVIIIYNIINFSYSLREKQKVIN